MTLDGAEPAMPPSASFSLPPVVLLDSNQLVADWRFTSIAMRLLRRLAEDHRVEVVLPPVVVAEVKARHASAFTDARTQLDACLERLRRLGVQVVAPIIPADYSAWLDEHLDESWFRVADWPNPSHVDLVSRANNRIPPFDAKGGGYRDTLIWFTALAYASRGREVILVSRDNAFADAATGALHTVLKAEVDDTCGSVELVRDLQLWLGRYVPEDAGLPEAVSALRDDRLMQYIFQSDFLSELRLLELLGATGVPSPPDIQIEGFEPIEQVRVAPQAGRGTRVTYDLPAFVSYEGRAPIEVAIARHWPFTVDPWGEAMVNETDIPVTLVLSAVFNPYDEMDEIQIDGLRGLEWAEFLRYLLPLPGQEPLPFED